MLLSDMGLRSQRTEVASARIKLFMMAISRDGIMSPGGRVPIARQNQSAAVVEIGYL
jgi:hypothetical protein